MSKVSLYPDKKFATWNHSRVADALYEEWIILSPRIEKDIKSPYGYRVTELSFQGEVNVTLDISKQRYPKKDYVELEIALRLSPDPNDLSTHVLNTFSIGSLIGLFPEVANKHIFSIKKDELWDGSDMQLGARIGARIIETLLNFESCFHLLLDDEYTIDGILLDSKTLSLTHHLNQAKAYQLAKIYGHPEKLNEAVAAIKNFARIDTYSRQRLEKLRAEQTAGGMDWLYTQDLLERLIN